MPLSTPPPQLPPAGWYSDPDGTGSRWWDGTRWTEHVQVQTLQGDQTLRVGRLHSIRRRTFGGWTLAVAVAILIVGGAAAYVAITQRGGTGSSPNPSLTLTAQERGLIGTVFGSFSRYCHSGDTNKTPRQTQEGFSIKLTPLATRLISLAREKPNAKYSSGGEARSVSDVVTDAASAIDPATCNPFALISENPIGEQVEAYGLLNRESLRGR